MGRPVQQLPWEQRAGGGGEGGAGEGAERALAAAVGSRLLVRQGTEGFRVGTEAAGPMQVHLRVASDVLRQRTTSQTAVSQIMGTIFPSSSGCCKHPMMFAKHVALFWDFLW